MIKNEKKRTANFSNKPATCRQETTNVLRSPRRRFFVKPLFLYYATRAAALRRRMGKRKFSVMICRFQRGCTIGEREKESESENESDRKIVRERKTGKI